MGRSDEPQLEELSRLLRRLETMEPGPKHDSGHNREPEVSQPPAEYVGALRGAAPARASDDGRNAVGAKQVDSYGAGRGQPRTDPGGRSSSTTAIVIGATTAAVVSSVVVVGLMTWTTGSERDDNARRLTFYAPAEQSTTRNTDTAPATRPESDAPVSPADAQPLLQRADAYLRSGKPDEARLVLEQAARAGSGVAALTLGAMYDPGRVAQFSNLGIKADPTVARAWYERAKDLGVAEASDRLAELAAR